VPQRGVNLMNRDGRANLVHLLAPLACPRYTFDAMFITGARPCPLIAHA
jgi:hypothetical protein